MIGIAWSAAWVYCRHAVEPAARPVAGRDIAVSCVHGGFDGIGAGEGIEKRPEPNEIKCLADIVKFLFPYMGPRSVDSNPKGG